MNRENDTITRAFKGILAVQIMSMLVGIAGCVIDGMIIGRFLGEEALAAFGLASSVTLIPAVAATILGTGASVVCSKSLGKGSLEQTRARFSACFSATAVICALLAVLIVSLAEPAARLVGARDSLSPMAADYIRGYGFACPGIILVALLMPLMQMDGEMKRLLAAVVAMTVGDVAADLMNVLVFHGGMLGMALATAFSYALALGILLPHLWKKGAIFSRPAFTPDRDTTVHMIAAGFPTATNQLGRIFLTFVLNRYLLSLGGGIAVAAHAVIMSAANLCMVPGFADGKPHRVELRLLKKEGAWLLRLRDDCPLFDPRDYLEQFAGSDPAANIGLKLLYGISADVTYLNALKLNNLLIRINDPDGRSENR